MRPRFVFAFLLVLVAAAMLLRSGDGALRPLEIGGSEVAAEAAREAEELTAPHDAMLARQLFGSDTPPADGLARAAAEARSLGTANAKWEHAGPTEYRYGGRVMDITVDPKLDSTIFVGTASGGVWRSDDLGATYAEAWPRENTQAIGALAQGPDGTLWAGTGEAGPGGGSLTFGGDGVYRSGDRGKNWEKLGLELSSRIGRIVVDPADPDRVFVAAVGPLYRAGGHRGLYLTEDGGETWSRVLKTDNQWTGAVDVALDPTDPEVVYATTWENQREPDRRRYTGLGSGLWKSTDGGQSFRRIGMPLFGPSPQQGRIGITVSTAGRLYVISTGESGLYNGLYRSDDDGATFTPIPTGAASQGATSGMSVYGWWFGRVWVDPTDENRIYVAGVSLSKTSNGGLSWSTDSRPHADHHAMAWDPDHPARVFSGHDGGVDRSEDRTTTWDTTGEPKRQPWLQLYSVDASQRDPGRMAAGLQDNGNLRNWRHGDEQPSEWREFLGGDGTRVKINPTDDSIVYACYQYGECSVYRGTASGSSFSAEVVGSRKNWSAPIEFDPANTATVLTGSEILSKSTDNGANWTPISPELSNGPGRETNPLFKNFGTIATIAPGPGASTIYAGTDDGNLWYTHAGGGLSPANWTKATDPDLPTAWITRVEVDPANAQTAYVTYSGFRTGDDSAYILRTTDGGRTWKDITGNLPRAPLNDVNLVGDRLVVGGDVGVFVSGRDGEKWEQLGKGLPLVPVFELRTTPDGDLLAGTFGRGIWRATLK